MKVLMIITFTVLVMNMTMSAVDKNWHSLLGWLSAMAFLFAGRRPE